MGNRTARDEQLLTLVDRLTAAGTESGLIDALRQVVCEQLPASTCAVVTRVRAHGDDQLVALAHRALIEGTDVRQADALALTGGDQGYPVLVLAVMPVPDEQTTDRLAQWAGLAARLLPGTRALQHEVARALPLQGVGSDAPLEQQLDVLRAGAAARDLHVVLGLVDQSVSPSLSGGQLADSQQALVRRLRRMLRSEDRVWALGDRILVAQVLPFADISLLVDRMEQAIRSAQAEEGVSRRLADVWATGDPHAGLAAAEAGLDRLARMREVGRRCLAGDPQPFTLLDDDTTFAVLIDSHRSILGANKAASRLLQRLVDDFPAQATDFQLYHPDGTPLAEDEMPGRAALRTGISMQDRILGIRFRDDDVHWGLVSTVAVDNEHGAPAGYVVAVSMLGAGQAVQHRVRDAMGLCPHPMVLMRPVRQAEQILDFSVAGLNARALTMLRAREEDVLGVRETDIYPFDSRLGLVLDYARVVETGESRQRQVVIPAGPLAGSYEVTAMPCEGDVLVVAHGLGEARSASESARLWDSLTGLTSRQGLLEQLRELDRAGQHAVTLVLLDIDDFSGVNDLLGRVHSDRFLIEVGRILAQVAGPRDVVARMGSDEFAVLTTTLTSQRLAQQFAEVVRQRLKSGVLIGDHRFTAASSVGVAWTAPGEQCGDLLSVADAAMAESKSAGGDTVRLGHRERHTPAMRAIAMESQLREAIEHGQFVLHYQPVVDLTTGAMEGAEALIRWQHPERGMVAPGDFIEVAERRHLITRIGEWVIERAFAELAGWREQLGYAPRLALNTSIGQLVRPGLARTILSQADHAGIDPQVVQLEITESQLLHADDSTLRNLLACRDTGCALVIDDFGTGHAGFDYLRHIPATVLKVDKTFIDGLSQDTTDAAIVAGVIAVGHGLGMRVVAEGVERDEQAQVLRGLGCDAAQGWLWYRALPPGDLLELLRARDVTG